jgi:hypothetical protein
MKTDKINNIIHAFSPAESSIKAIHDDQIIRSVDEVFDGYCSKKGFYSLYH